jgi:serine/threonine protein phosphatase PrpC
MLNSNKIKEFFNLNGYYLRLYLTNQDLSLTSFNSNLLNGIKYESKINSEEIKRNEKLKNLTVYSLYELISKKISEKKALIQGDLNAITLSLLENAKSFSNNDVQIILLKNNRSHTSEYENVLSNVIKNLKEENRNIKNEINEIKNLVLQMNGSMGVGGNPSIRPTMAQVKVIGNQNVDNISNEINMVNNQIKNSLPNPSINNPLQYSINNNISEELKAQISEPIPNTINNSLFNANPLIANKDNKIIPQNIINQPQVNIMANKNFLPLSIDYLANLEYNLYPKVELSPYPFNKIVAYGANSYHGISKNYNEDKYRIIYDYKLRKTVNTANGSMIFPCISYFGLYDGHAGSKCSTFIQEKLHTFLLESNFFPLYPLQAINEAYLKAEQEFQAIAYDPINNILLDKSGSCSLSILMIDETCYVIYLGDSRALYSFDSGKHLFQITRDQKPNDLIERMRIEKAGGRIYKDTRLKINGQKIHVKEESYPGVNFPFRVHPANLSVS